MFDNEKMIVKNGNAKMKKRGLKLTGQTKSVIQNQKRKILFSHEQSISVSLPLKENCEKNKNPVFDPSPATPRNRKSLSPILLSFPTSFEPPGPPVPASKVAASILPFDFTTPSGAVLSAAVTNNEVILRRVLHHLTLGEAIRVAPVNRAFRAARATLCGSQRRAIILVGNLAGVQFLHYHKRESELVDEKTGKPVAVNYPMPSDYTAHGLKLLELSPSSVQLTRKGLFCHLTELSIAESPVVLWHDCPLYSWLKDLRHSLVTFRLRLSNLNHFIYAAPYINRLRALRHLTLLNVNFDFDLLSERLMRRLHSMKMNIDQFSGNYHRWMEVIADRDEEEAPLQVHMSKFTGPLWITDWAYFVDVPQTAAACFTAIPLMANIPLIQLQRLGLTYTHLTDLELNHPLGSLPDIIAALEPLTRLTFLTLEIISPTVEYPNIPFNYGDDKYPLLRRLPSVRYLKVAFNLKVHVDLTAWQLRSTFPHVQIADLMVVKFPCEECINRNIAPYDCLRNGVKWAQKRWSHVPKLNFRIAYGFTTRY